MRSAAVLLLVAVGACGGRVSTVDDPTPSPTSTTTTPAPKPTGGLPPSPVPPKPEPEPEPKEIFYTAHGTSGAMDTLHLVKADYSNGRCTRITMGRPAPSVKFPEVKMGGVSWAVMEVRRVIGDASACDSGKSMKESEGAVDGKGEVTWSTTETGPLPCELEVHATFLFTDAPTAESFDAKGVKHSPNIYCK